MKPNLFERAIAAVAPQYALKRAEARTRMTMLDSLGSGQGFGGGGSRAFRGWGVSANSADADLLPKLDELRARCRDLFMNSPMATGAIKTVRTNTVGQGLRLQCAIDREFLGMTAEQADAWETATEREFRLWSESKLCSLDASQNFYDLQCLVELSALMSGDVFALMPYRTRKGMPYRLRVQLIEADRVCTPFGQDHDDRIHSGIELDADGAPAAYHVTNRHPGDWGAVVTPQLAWKRVPAFGAQTGRRNVLHVFAMERPEQRRGVPYLAPIIEQLKQLTRYQEAELMAAVISGMLTVFVETETGNGLDEGFDLSEKVSSNPAHYELGNGAIIELDPGQSVKDVNPGRPNAAFEAFVNAVIRQIGVALEIPFEILQKHFSASYSASRAALLEFWKFARMRRAWLVSNFVQPVYEEWLTEAVSIGRINAPGYFEDPAIRAAFCGSEWVGPTPGQVDPLKEVQAAKMRIDECLSTRSREAAELNGGDYSRIIELREWEEKRRDEAGLIPDNPQALNALIGAEQGGNNNGGGAQGGE